MTKPNDLRPGWSAPQVTVLDQSFTLSGDNPHLSETTNGYEVGGG